MDGRGGRVLGSPVPVGSGLGPSGTDEGVDRNCRGRRWCRPSSGTVSPRTFPKGRLVALATRLLGVKSLGSLLVSVCRVRQGFGLSVRPPVTLGVD